MKEKRIRIIFFVTIICIIFFSICFFIKNKSNSSKEQEEKIQEERANKNLVYGITKIDTLNPITSKNQDIQYISKLIYEPLIDITEDFRLKEGLATEWGRIDNKTYILILNKNKKWHNGREFTAKDVKYTIDYIKNIESIYKNNIKNIEEVNIINEYTVKIKLFEEEENFEYMLCFPIICEEENIGTGKYKLNIENQNEIVLKEVEKNKEIIVRIYNNLKDLYNAFNKNDIDIITTKKVNYEDYIGKIGYNKIKIYGRNFDFLKFNMQSKVLSNVEVIDAIQYAINKKQIISKIYNNTYLQAEFPLQYGSYLYKNNIGYEYNINRAQKTLENSGWKYNRKILDKRWKSDKTRTNNK